MGSRLTGRLKGIRWSATFDVPGSKCERDLVKSRRIERIENFDFLLFSPPFSLLLLPAAFGGGNFFFFGLAEPKFFQVHTCYPEDNYWKHNTPGSDGGAG